MRGKNILSIALFHVVLTYIGHAHVAISMILLILSKELSPGLIICSLTVCRHLVILA